MNNETLEIQQTLTDFGLELSEADIDTYVAEIKKAQEYFPLVKQRALAIKLILDWENHQNRKILTACSQICSLEGSTCVTGFGVLSVDWPGLSNACLGVVHEMGWNIYFMKGFSLSLHDKPIGIVIIGIRTDDEAVYQKLIDQIEIIESKLRQAAVGEGGKAVLLNEEMRKLEIYSRVIQEIQRIYFGENLEDIIGLDGEAVKFFAARSRDYIENRKIEDIARQIIMNYEFIQKVTGSDKNIQLEIKNFETHTEGCFTGITVAGPAKLLNLEDCLKTIELTIPHFILKHNREFTTNQAISLYRIEFVDAEGKPLSELDQKRLHTAFKTLVLEKKRDRAQWIESIGGFEQYARAIIPLLVREAQSTGVTQVYQAVGNMTDLFIDFKIFAVLPENVGYTRETSNKLIDAIESVHGLHIQTVKPAKKFGTAHLIILDTRASLAVIDNHETIYQLHREKLKSVIGNYRDFDEGMRNMDAVKFKSVRAHLKEMDKTLFRELFYSIEDFLRVSAPVFELVGHIRMARDMIASLDPAQPFFLKHEDIGNHTPSGEFKPKATLVAIGFVHEAVYLKDILEILEPCELTMSRLERTGWDILICRITENDRALPLEKTEELIGKLKGLIQKK